MKPCEIKFSIEDNNVDFDINSNDVNFDMKDKYVVSEQTSYAPLTEKPQINYKTLQSGNNTYEYLGVEPTITDISEQDIDTIIYGG